MPRRPSRQKKSSEHIDHIAQSFPFVRQMHISFARIETFLTFLIGIFIIFFILIALIGVVSDVIGPLFHGQSYTLAALKGIDAAFLAIILLELFHTIRSQSTLSIQLQEFLIIGITSAVRHGLELAAAGSTAPNQQSIVINLVINALAVFILVAALWLIRREQRKGEEV